jgi:hypothetical protein
MQIYIILVLVGSTVFFAYLAKHTPYRWAEWMWNGFSVVSAFAAIRELAALCR